MPVRSKSSTGGGSRKIYVNPNPFRAVKERATGHKIGALGKSKGLTAIQRTKGPNKPATAKGDKLAGMAATNEKIEERRNLKNESHDDSQERGETEEKTPIGPPMYHKSINRIAMDKQSGGGRPGRNHKKGHPPKTCDESGRKYFR